MIVVGCGKQKRAESAPAKDLYIGSLFRMARRYAEARGGPWVILSAAHGVIDPDWIIRPYDAALELKDEALRQWARKAALAIEQRYETGFGGRLLGTPVEILAGMTYAAPLARELGELGLRWQQPLVGLGTGARLQKLKGMAEVLHEAAASRREKERERHVG